MCNNCDCTCCRCHVIGPGHTMPDEDHAEKFVESLFSDPKVRRLIDYLKDKETNKN